MSNPLKSEFFCIADDDFLSIVDKLHANNLSEEDKKLIAHIMINHRHVMYGLLKGTIKGKDLEKQIKKLGDEVKKIQESKKVEEKLNNNENPVDKNNSDKNSQKADPTEPEKTTSNSSEGSQNNSDTSNNNDSQNNEPGKIKPKSKKKKKKQEKKKNGKRGHKEFSDAEEKKHVFDPDFIRSSACPCCGENNKLYSIQPAVTVLFVGKSPILPEVHITEKARCSSCGETMTPQVPVEVENSVGRFLPSAVAQIAVQRFSLGFPHSRMENLTNLYGIRIPDSNQWSTIETVAMEMEPLFDI